MSTVRTLQHGLHTIVCICHSKVHNTANCEYNLLARRNGPRSWLSKQCTKDGNSTLISKACRICGITTTNCDMGTSSGKSNDGTTKAKKSTGQRTDRAAIEESSRAGITTGQSQKKGAINNVVTDLKIPTTPDDFSSPEVTEASHWCVITACRMATSHGTALTHHQRAN